MSRLLHDPSDSKAGYLRGEGVASATCDALRSDEPALGMAWACGGQEDHNPSSTSQQAPPQQQQNLSFMQAARSQALRPFVIISSSYLLFTITDGAIRMIVLLHAYNQSFSAFEVAIMFTLYELAGVFTNLAAGVMGAKWGIKFTLIIGLSLQLLSYGLLFGWQDDWTKAQALVYVTGKRSRFCTFGQRHSV
jgi:Na+/melibiose symporter-like transporter